MSEDKRQKVEKVHGSRRARLTPVDGTLSDSDAEATLRGDSPELKDDGSRGPNDARLRQDKPPHYG
ncbi:hypothetical protein [Microbacterium amylolyticum]|uniref:Multidrug transporter n=1 Tax=Microbacterium amylolyticum TaxID=936337 RepID=A0ABS4ZJ04_9MICO|nr:hypothetical protein [Microbacterium amylolyticum]MBP2437275.1 hypothetical protein [Microbacterium amylolyticum]